MRRIVWLREHLPPKVWDNLATISILGMLAVLTFFGVQIINLTEHNHDRIRDIQKSRVESCERTYEGVRQVFDPFLPDHPRGKQRRDIQKFNDTIDRLKRTCPKQTSPKETK